MRWPWSLHQPTRPSPDARVALNRAEQALNEAQRRDRRAQHVADRSEAVRQRNHFAEAIEKTIRGEA